MTQATLQVKHDPVLAHKLADLEINGMGSIYNGKYCDKPMEYGLVGNRITKSGPDLMVPLGKNTFDAAVNQSYLQNYVEEHKAEFFKTHDETRQDYTFHSLDDQDVKKILKNFRNFDKSDKQIDAMTTEELNKYREGFDKATRPLLSKWDPKTGKQLDDKANRLNPDGSINPKALAHSLKQMTEKAGVPLPIDVEEFVAKLTTQDDKGRTHTMSLNERAGEHAGTLMRAKQGGFDPIMKEAMLNTEAILNSKPMEAKSLFGVDDAEIHQMTVKERQDALAKQYQQQECNVQHAEKNVNHMLAKSADFVEQTLGKQFGTNNPQVKQVVKLMQEANNKAAQNKTADGKAERLHVNLMHVVKSLPDDSPASRQGKALIKQLDKYAVNYLMQIKRARIRQRDAQERAAEIPTLKERSINQVQEQVLCQGGLAASGKNWQKKAQAKGWSALKIKQMQKQLAIAKKQAEQTFSQKKVAFIDVKPKNHDKFMDTVFQPELMSTKATSQEIKASQFNFVHDSAVQSAIEVNKLLTKQIKASHLVVGGMKTVDHDLQKTNPVEAALRAKHNCEKLIDLASSPNKGDQTAFKIISQATNDQDLKLGTHKRSDKFLRQLQSMSNQITVAQSKLCQDPMISQKTKKSTTTEEANMAMAKARIQEKLDQDHVGQKVTSKTHAKMANGQSADKLDQAQRQQQADQIKARMAKEFDTQYVGADQSASKQADTELSR